MLSRRQLLLGLAGLTGVGVAGAAAFQRFGARAKDKNPDHVLIVGSGATGLMTAAELLAAGIPVSMLAIGPLNTPDAASRWPNVPVEAGTETPRSEYRWVRTHQVGGRMTKWSRMSLRYGRDDFEGAPDVAPHLVWPIGYDVLEPHYEKAERLLDIFGGKEACPITPPGTVAREGASALAVPLTSRVASRGACAIGARMARFNPVTYVDDVLLKNPKFALHPNAEVLRVDVDPAGGPNVTVTYRDGATNKEETVRGIHVVLAAGAVATAKILLASDTPRSPKGLGNDAEVVGAYLNDHALFKCRLNTKLTLPPGDDDKHAVVVGAQKLLDDKIFGGFGRIQLQLAAKALGGDEWQINVTGFANVPPLATNRVALGGSDARGRKVRFQYAANDHHTALKGLRRAVEALFPKEDIRDVWENVPGDAVHDLGTCRMGTDPRTSVIDPTGKIHGVSRVTVADGGAMPYQVEKNPTLTMMAIASYFANGLVRSLRT